MRMRCNQRNQPVCGELRDFESILAVTCRHGCCFNGCHTFFNYNYYPQYFLHIA